MMYVKHVVGSFGVEWEKKNELRPPPPPPPPLHEDRNVKRMN